MQGIYVAIGAVIGAWISSLVAGHYNKKIKEMELEAQKRANNTPIALQCAQLKHQQLVAGQDWDIRTSGKARPVDFWDPLHSVIEYLDGMDEHSKTGKWQKAKQSHCPNGLPWLLKE